MPEVVGEFLSGVIVEVEEEREKVLASGARCVSLSSEPCQLCHAYVARTL